MRHLFGILVTGMLAGLIGSFTTSCVSRSSPLHESGAARGKNPIISVSENIGRVTEKPEQHLKKAETDADTKMVSSGIPVPDSNVLILRSGTYLGVSIGMDEKSVRQTLASRNPGVALREMPYGTGGNLISIENNSFRFTAQGTLFQIYALNEDTRIEGDLKLQQSTVADFEKFLGAKAEKSVTANGVDQFRLNTDGMEILLIPRKENPDVVVSMMLTKKE